MDDQYIQRWTIYDGMILTVMQQYRHERLSNNVNHPMIPIQHRPYVKAALGHYAEVLEQYYEVAMDESPQYVLRKPEIRER